MPKSEEGKFRVIHDLSFPKNNSVNSRIPPENSQVTYDFIDTITMLVQQFGEGALMSKTDIQDAFRIIPIHFNDHKLLGFSWEGSYYYDKCLPMGASSSCQIFESLSTSIQWVMYKKFQASGMSHMLDDIFFIGPKDSPSCQIALENFLDICAEAGIPIKHEKNSSALNSYYYLWHRGGFCSLPEPRGVIHCPLDLWPVFLLYPTFFVGRQQTIVYLLYDSLVFYCFQLLYYISLSFE